jgi:hypothetical protein
MSGKERQRQLQKLKANAKAKDETLKRVQGDGGYRKVGYLYALMSE